MVAVFTVRDIVLIALISIIAFFICFDAANLSLCVFLLVYMRTVLLVMYNTPSRRFI